ncbi:MAG: hypothetical protein WC866_01965 [Patescibacteria group bacterium]|jgi:hypothetical protein
MAENDLSIEEKEKKLQEAYNAFMTQLRGLEADRLSIMKRVISDLEREEIALLLKELQE